MSSSESVNAAVLLPGPSVLELVLSPSLSLALAVDSCTTSGRTVTVKLKGQCKPFGPGLRCEASCLVRRPDLPDERHALGCVELAGSEHDCTVTMTLDVYRQHLFGTGTFELALTPELPQARPFRVKDGAKLKFEHPLELTVKKEPDFAAEPVPEGAGAPEPDAASAPTSGQAGAAGAPAASAPAAGAAATSSAPPAVLVGSRFHFTPGRRADLFKDAPTRVNLRELSVTGESTDHAYFAEVLWDKDDRDEREVSLGCVRSRDGAVFCALNPNENDDTFEVEVRFEVADAEGCFYPVWTEKLLNVPAPRLTAFSVSGDGQAPSSEVIASGRIENLGTNLRLDLSLWELREVAGRKLVMSPVHLRCDGADGEPVEVVHEVLTNSKGEFRLALPAAELLPPPEVKLFALLRLSPGAVAPGVTAPVPDLLRFDPGQFRAFAEWELADAPPAQLPAKPLFAAIASTELAGPAERRPCFGGPRLSVLNEQLVVSFALLGPESYWNKASPRFWWREAEGQPQRDPIALQVTTPEKAKRVRQAQFAMNDKRVLGKTLEFGAEVTADAEWAGATLKSSEGPSSRRVFECVPRLGPTLVQQEQLHGQRSLVFRCATSFFPTGKTTKTLALQIQQHYQGRADPLSMWGFVQSSVAYDAPSGPEGRVAESGEFVARLSKPDALNYLTEEGEYSIEVVRSAEGSRLFGFEVKSAPCSFGKGKRSLQAGALLFGAHPVIPEPERQAFAEAVVDLAHELSDQMPGKAPVDPSHLMLIMFHETNRTFDPAKVGAAPTTIGLIQFQMKTPAQAAELETTLERLSRQTRVEQVKGPVTRYFRRRFKAYPDLRPDHLGDLYCCVLWPEGLKSNPDQPFTVSGTQARILKPPHTRNRLATQLEEEYLAEGEQTQLPCLLPRK